MYPKNLLLKNPNNTWSFVGRVSVKLSWLNKDGSLLTDAQAQKLIGASNPGMHARVRVFKSRDEAIEAAKVLGVEYHE